MNGHSRIRYPDFICIGAQKAGSTWLHRELNHHPDIWLPPFKEIQYFNRIHPPFGETVQSGLKAHDERRSVNMLNAIKTVVQGGLPTDEKVARIHCLSLIARAERTDEWYGRIFGMAPESAICGEVSPDYAMLRIEGIEHILRLQPRCKFIFIMRDPIERGWSYLRMGERQRGVELTVEQISSRACLAYSNYMATITRYRRCVAEENFLLLCFDDIENSPRELLQRACSFVGVDAARAPFKNADESANPGHKKEMDTAVYARFLQVFAPVYQQLLELHHPTINAWYTKHYGSARAGGTHQADAERVS